MNKLQTRFGWMVVCGCACLLMGCATFPDDSSAETAQETISQDDEGIPVRFPPCFLIEGAQLNEHGRIPATPLVGAGITVDENLAVVYQAYQDVLAAQGWTTDREENAVQSFRIMASLAGANIEIRAVKGTSGPTQVFLLYTPAN